MRISLLLFLTLSTFCACYSIPALSVETSEQAASQNTAPAQEATSADESEKDEERSFVTELLLYLPNRVIDLFDIVRAGVSVGPGIGVDLTATEYLNVTLLTKASVGVGYETLRHLPIEAASYAMVGAGPVKLAADPGIAWPRSPGDFRVEVHLLLVGAHAAVEVLEIFDFLAGIATFDPMEDDF